MVIYYAHKPVEDHNPQIYVMQLDGSELRLFAEARGHSWGPVTSVDGTRLMFSSVTREDHTIHTADGGGLVGSGNHDIYTLDVVGSDYASLSSANIHNTTVDFTSWDNGWSWTIDGEWITFTSDRPTADGSTDWEIYLMRPDGSEIIQLTDTPYNEGWPVWTPDGTQIVYTSNETGNDEIYIMNADGTNPQRLTDRPDSNELFPSVSPDGTRVIFSSQVPAVNEGNIWIMNIDGSDPRQLTSTAALNNIPAWCPAGDLIVWVSDVRGNDNVYIMNADGSGLTQLTDDAGEDTTPHCSILPAGTP
jgi:TolB protein